MEKVINGPEFRVGDAFPATDGPQAAVAALLVATQPLVVTARLQQELEQFGAARTAAREESSLFLLVQSIGITHEALDAFRRADERGVFIPVLTAEDPETTARYPAVN